MFVAIENLRLRALALRSSVHNEQQLTAVELAAMNAKKTNELIDVVNELCEIVEGLTVGKLEFKYDPYTETLNIVLKEG